MTTIKNLNNQTSFQGLPKVSKGKLLSNKGPEFIEKIKSAVNIDEVYEYLDKCSSGQNPSIKKLESNIFQIKDYFIRIGMSFNTESLAQTLKSLSKLELSCAPKYITSKNFKDGSAVLVTKIKSHTSDLPMKSFAMVKSEVPLESKTLFMEDIEKLLKNDIMNPAITSTTQNWFVIPGSNRIYIDDWGQLKPVYSTLEKNNCKKTISNMCGLIYD